MSQVIRVQLSEIEELLNSNSLTKDERSYLDTIIEELSESGSSEALSELWSTDYDQIPVDIRTFITDPYYLGNSFTDDEGNSLIYPYWVDTLEKVFSSDSEVYETVFSGAIGIGVIKCLARW